MYSVPDDAWYLELDLVREQRAVVTAVIPDEDPAREPTVCFDPQGRHLDIPYEVMQWFMDQVAEEIRTSRAWMRLRPELIEVIPDGTPMDGMQAFQLVAAGAVGSDHCPSAPGSEVSGSC
ncbi:MULTISPECIES: hypothetical protein [unclassified Kitasatospora]|uniref:hypothetical protein n=1 Tax=unclassified Kitasatospora TaxID=2633591 RepID=UPI0033D893CD